LADILQQLIIKAPRERVFEMFATPQGLDRWWTKTSRGKPQLNAEFTLFFGPGYDWRATVSRCSSPSAFELLITQAHPDWLGTRVGCELEAENAAATTVRFYHIGWPPGERALADLVLLLGDVSTIVAAVPGVW
jgi:uncharacterized protein YndB with AHSA1/START domain